jgi:uncharacterized membrane protein YozB (DUF420 family)
LLTPTLVILSLKYAVGAVTVLLCISLVALANGKVRLHGKINLIFFILTLAALFLFEIVVRMIDPVLFTGLWKNAELAKSLKIHLWFAVPSALLMGIMLFTGLRRLKTWHRGVSVIFLVCWFGTFYTGIFWLPNYVEVNNKAAISGAE